MSRGDEQDITEENVAQHVAQLRYKPGAHFVVVKIMSVEGAATWRLSLSTPAPNSDLTVSTFSASVTSTKDATLPMSGLEFLAWARALAHQQETHEADEWLAYRPFWPHEAPAPSIGTMTVAL